MGFSFFFPIIKLSISDWRNSLISVASVRLVEWFIGEDLNSSESKNHVFTRIQVHGFLTDWYIPVLPCSPYLKLKYLTVASGHTCTPYTTGSKDSLCCQFLDHRFPGTYWVCLPYHNRLCSGFTMYVFAWATNINWLHGDHRASKSFRLLGLIRVCWIISSTHYTSSCSQSGTVFAKWYRDSGGL